jgi:aldehyde dehydrogenase (NAD+)
VHWAGQEDIDDAVASSTQAFEVYGKSAGCDRRGMMLKLADLIEKHRVQLSQVESMDNGKPQHIADAVDIGFVVECFRYYAGWTDKVAGAGKVLATTRDTHSTFSYTRHEPIGVCGAIIPWNFPLLMQAWKLGPALAMGCTVIMKLSEKTPLSGMMIGHLINEAGFPPGTVNLVNGFGPDTGNMISSHMGIKKIAFTGSGPVGRHIIRASANSNMKKVSLELGGKSAMIVCKDADLDEAAIASHVGLFLNMGQVCSASSRIFVHEDVHDEFVKKSVALASQLRQGKDAGGDKPTAVPICDMGPQVDKLQFEKVMAYIEAGKKEGAKCVLGGKRLGTKGYFVEPTIFTDVQDDMKICREEIFGPVMQLLKFKDNAEAVRRANSSEFGLAAGVCSRDIGSAIAIAHALDAGSVWINTYDNFDMACPFGGYKESGWGSDKGEYALANYTITKCVTTPIGNCAHRVYTLAPAHAHTVTSIFAHYTNTSPTQRAHCRHEVKMSSIPAAALLRPGL